MRDCICRSIRVQIRTTAAFTREVEGDVHRVVGYFQTTPELINSSTDLDVDGIRSSLDSQVENFNARGSGFTIDRILQFTIVITKSVSYTHLTLPTIYSV